MKNYLDSKINFRTKIIFVKMPQKQQNRLKNVEQKRLKNDQKIDFFKSVQTLSQMSWVFRGRLGGLAPNFKKAIFGAYFAFFVFSAK